MNGHEETHWGTRLKELSVTLVESTAGGGASHARLVLDGPPEGSGKECLAAGAPPRTAGRPGVQLGESHRPPRAEGPTRIQEVQRRPAGGPGGSSALLRSGGSEASCSRPPAPGERSWAQSRRHVALTSLPARGPAAGRAEHKVARCGPRPRRSGLRALPVPGGVGAGPALLRAPLVRTRRARLPLAQVTEAGRTHELQPAESPHAHPGPHAPRVPYDDSPLLAASPATRWGPAPALRPHPGAARPAPGPVNHCSRRRSVERSERKSRPGAGPPVWAGSEWAWHPVGRAGPASWSPPRPKGQLKGLALSRLPSSLRKPPHRSHRAVQPQLSTRHPTLWSHTHHAQGLMGSH